MAEVIHLADHVKGARRKSSHVNFTRQELDQILAVYFKHVSKGEWRDYAIDQGRAVARFSVFRHARDHPLFTVVKLTPRGDAYALYNAQRKLRQSARLGAILTLFDKPLKTV